MTFQDYKSLLDRLGRNSIVRVKGLKCFRSGLVKKVELEQDELQVVIHGMVVSESVFKKYETEIVIDPEKNKVVFVECDCPDHARNSEFNDTYACKHVIATAEKFLDSLSKARTAPSRPKEASDYGKYVLEVLDSASKRGRDRIRLEVKMSRVNSYLGAYHEVEFKIGLDRMYVLKNVKEFVEACRNRTPLKYGKEFEFNILNQDFSKEDEKLVKFMEEYVDMDARLDDGSFYGHSSKLVSGKTLRVYPGHLRRFLQLAKHRKIQYQMDYGEHAGIQVLEENLPLAFSLQEDEEENMILKAQENMPVPLNKDGEACLYEGKIYLPDDKQCRSLAPLWDILKKNREIKFKKEDCSHVVTRLLPVMQEISKNVDIDRKIREKIVNEELQAKFYLDKENGDTVLNFKLTYGENEFDYFEFFGSDKYILRDEEKEEQIINILDRNKFNVFEKKFIFRGNDEEYFKLVTEGLKDLSQLGEVYYSDRFRESRVYSAKSISASISKDKNDYLDFTFQIGDIDPKEMKNILGAFREKRRFFRLKDNSFIDLSEKEMKNFLKVLDNLTEDGKLSQNSIKLQNSKAMYLDSVIEDNDMRFIQGRHMVSGISEKIRNMEALDLSLPENLDATLREYQKTGYNWFKTLASFGFGGILADEMGLGKTIQTIAFLLSEPFSKSLIVAPTSLVYNWKNEFERFAPSMKVLVLHGTREERELLMGEAEEYDVILTTYNLLRIDFDFYKEKIFDYVITDEAQNIKNPLSQNAEAVKDMKGRVKFALTGTPMENSLMELWSIFDFVLPGYLFNRTKFASKFIKNFEDEETLEELNRLIRPFILRRRKKDVMMELPDKIEKRLVVDMTYEQKKVYKACADDIKRNLQQYEKGEMHSKAMEVLAYLTKLRQLCLDPSILVEGYEGGSGKLDALFETLNQGIDEGHKILVFSQFTRVLESISSMLEDQHIEHFYLDGSTKAQDRIEMVDEFNEGNTKVFLISLKAGGTGLNLTGADMVIHFDPWWNPAVEDQATDRAHRFGQKNVVEVVKLISKGTIEEKILKLQDDKKEIIEKVMNGEFNKGSILRELSEKEILDLFS